VKLKTTITETCNVLLEAYVQDVVNSSCVRHKRVSEETVDGEGDERTGGLVMTKTGEHVTVWA